MRQHTNRWTTLIALCFVAVLNGQMTAADGTSDIAAAMQQYIKDHQISGAVTLAARNGKVVHHAAHGLADVDTQRQMKKDTMFWIASMTKPITATAVLILQDDGKLSVDDPASKYLPAFKNSKLASGEPPSRPVTIRDLMTHTSGVAGPGRMEGQPTLAEIAENIATRPLQFEPGSKWKYGNGLTVCGRIIEIVSGKSYQDFLAERIFKPLGMKDTTFYPDAEQRKRFATLYQPGKDGKPFEPAVAWFVSYDPQVRRAPNPSGGLASTTSDLFRFYQAILNGGELDGRRIVSENAVKQMTTIHTGDLVTGFTPGNGWGLGWCVVRHPQGVTDMLKPGTFGHGGAFGTQGWVDPERDMIFVLMIQRTRFGNADGSDIRGTFQRLAIEKASP